MTWFTMQATYAGYFANTVAVEADTLEEALGEGHRGRQPGPQLEIGGPLRSHVC